MKKNLLGLHVIRKIYKKKSYPFRIILHKFDILFMLRTYSARLWEKLLFTWLFGQVWYPCWHSSAPTGLPDTRYVTRFCNLWSCSYLCFLNSPLREYDIDISPDDVLPYCVRSAGFSLAMGWFPSVNLIESHVSSILPYWSWCFLMMFLILSLEIAVILWTLQTDGFQSRSGSHPDTQSRSLTPLVCERECLCNTNFVWAFF